MFNIRHELEAREAEMLAPWASLSCESTRDIEVEEDQIRTSFQRDRDRILHSDSFQRLKKKTQVITTAFEKESDHYRTRLTHSLEVAQIGRVIALSLNLNADLVEAAGLGHDLGHTPFGHAGEAVLNKRYDFGFHHSQQSIRVVEKLENNGKGLNLTKEVKEAIEHHSGISNDMTGVTLETKILPFADKIAYLSSDLEDAVKFGLISYDDLPLSVKKNLGFKKSDIINTLVYGIISESKGKPEVKMDEEVFGYMTEYRNWMFENVYQGDVMEETHRQAMKIVEFLCDYYEQHPEQIQDMTEPDNIQRSVCDWVAGMSDEYAINAYKDLNKRIII